MAEKTKPQLKVMFKGGDTPTTDQYKDLIDSQLNLTENQLVSGDNTFSGATTFSSSPVFNGRIIETMKCTYVNDGNQTVTFAVATGTTITNVANTVATNSSCTLICRMTAAATVDVTIADN